MAQQNLISEHLLKLCCASLCTIPTSQEGARCTGFKANNRLSDNPNKAISPRCPHLWIIIFCLISHCTMTHPLRVFPVCASLYPVTITDRICRDSKLFAGGGAVLLSAKIRRLTNAIRGCHWYDGMSAKCAWLHKFPQNFNRSAHKYITS
jgi:hypothetical protein